MTELTVFVDVDDVVADLLSAWLERYNNDYDDSLDMFSIKSWGIGNYVKPECGTKIYDYLEDPTLYDKVYPIYGAHEGINALKSLRSDIRIVYATSSTRGSSGRKLKWLLDNGFLDKGKLTGSVHPDYIEVHDKSLLRGDVLIDDNQKNIAVFNGFGILFSRPHNENFNWPTRAYEWTDIFKILSEDNIPVGNHPVELYRPVQTRMFKAIFEKMYQTHLEKNMDYSPANILGTGEIGLTVRTWDKVSRLMNLMGFKVEISGSTYNHPQEPRNESIKDNILDLSTYSIIWQIYRNGGWGK